jgi:hypothetical protein
MRIFCGFKEGGNRKNKPNKDDFILGPSRMVHEHCMAYSTILNATSSATIRRHAAAKAAVYVATSSPADREFEIRRLSVAAGLAARIDRDQRLDCVEAGTVSLRIRTEPLTNETFAPPACRLDRGGPSSLGLFGRPKYRTRGTQRKTDTGTPLRTRPAGARSVGRGMRSPAWRTGRRTSMCLAARRADGSRASVPIVTG